MRPDGFQTNFLCTLAACTTRVYVISTSPSTVRSQDFLEHLRQSLAGGTFLGLTLSKPAASHADPPRRQSVRPIELQSRPMLQWTLDADRRQTHKNLTPEESLTRTGELFGHAYRNAHLFTTQADITARITKSGECRITTARPSKLPPDTAVGGRVSSAANGPASVQSSPDHPGVFPQRLAHDRQKQHLIPEGVPCPFLEALGVMTATGQVRRAKARKFKQINRYLEFVEDVYQHLPDHGRLEVIDFGCGLSYLTFALHHLLTQIHGRDVRIRGIDRSEDVIARCRQTAADLQLAGLEFTCGDIDSQSCADGPVHLLVSLHACDTATDEALAQAVRGQANVILAAPCCQHELFTRLESDPLALLTRHGILKERLAALATDALRAAVLETRGYRTQVIEFIDTEHTPKNLLLRAVRRPQPAADPTLPARIDTLKNLLGITTTRLEELLDS